MRGCETRCEKNVGAKAAPPAVPAPLAAPDESSGELKAPDPGRIFHDFYIYNI